MLKKGEVFIILLIGIFLAGIATVRADLVCGHEANSSLGYGQVTILGVNVTCNNIADGICPEDYEDGGTGNPVSCSSCPDPDCTGTLYGTVTDLSAFTINGATVTTHPSRYNPNAQLENSTITNSNGFYNFTAISGRYAVTASKEGYDTEVLDVVVTRNQSTQLNFALANGTCHDDCTNYYSRCNAACDGTTFNNGATNCTFYNTTIATLCNNRLKGTSVFVAGYNATYAYFVDCCEGAPALQYYAPSTIGTDSIKNLVTTEKIARYNEQPVRLIIAYWEPVNQQ